MNATIPTISGMRRFYLSEDDARLAGAIANELELKQAGTSADGQSIHFSFCKDASRDDVLVSMQLDLDHTGNHKRREIHIRKWSAGMRAVVGDFILDLASGELRKWDRPIGAADIKIVTAVARGLAASHAAIVTELAAATNQDTEPRELGELESA